MSSKVEQTVEGHVIRLSNLEKVLYPEVGLTKAGIIDYYARIAPVLLPHLAGRPITLKRYPDGVESTPFFEKNCPRFKPPWLETAPVWSRHKEAHTNFCLINSLAGLVWIVNLATLEIHPSLSLAANLDSPTAVAFDLDPGPPADIVTCARVSLLLREVLDGLGLKAFPKTSGSKGLQVYVPLNTRTSYEQTKSFAHGIARWLEQRHPDLILSNMKKELRRGKVFVDWSQNDVHKTTVSVYSLRARERPTVSTPITWDEVAVASRRRGGSVLRFEIYDVLARVKQEGDLFAPVLKLKQRLPALH